MRNCALLASGVDVAPIAEELDAHPELWDEHPFRTFKEGPFDGTGDIWVRWRAREELTEPKAFREMHFPVWYPAWRLIPSIQPVVYGMMAQLRAVHLGGILFTRIPPGGEIKPHHDRGSWHAEFYNAKVYLIVRANPECLNTFEDEQVIMRPGEAWLFNNLVTHAVYNRGDTERVTLIVCMRVEP